MYGIFLSFRAEKFGNANFFAYLCVSKRDKNMTQAELHFLERVPQLLAQLVSELKTMNEKLSKIEERLDTNNQK